MPASISRRRFALAGFAALTARKGFSAASVDKQVEVRLDREIATIRPELHGHFAEHLGSCIYGGIWVGPKSPIPNINGYRRAAVDYLKALGLVVLRWPGGCFADDYHWRDGIGPVEKRPKTVNIHWGNYTEDNSFGTHEFIQFCRLIGAEPYLAGNVGSGTPEELRDWVEYCNYPSGSALSDERARNGSPEPFRVRYWGVGNENWGCGGNMTPEEYAAHFRRFATYIRTFGDTRPFLIACGPNRNNLEWTRRFMDNMERRGSLHGYAMHFYSNGKAPATKHTADTAREQLSSFAAMEKAILEQRALLDKYDPQRRIGLLIDEWGVWDRMVPEEERRYGRLWQQITMRCATAAALGLNVFHRQADKLVMCNIAQTVNVLHAMLLTDGPQCVRTASYYAFEMLKPHRGNKALALENPEADPLALSVSASVRERTLVLSLVNPRLDAAVNARISLTGGKVSGAKARLLHHPDLNAYNSFEKPDAIVPRDTKAEAAGGRILVTVPPLGIVTVTATLA